MILVIGGSSGIGKKISDELRNDGQEVITISRTEIEEDSNHLACDISNFKQLKKTYQKIKQKKLVITAIINCAGIASMNLALTTPPETTEKLIRTNLIGTIFCNQIFSPLLIRNKFGRISRKQRHPLYMEQ